MVIFDAGKFGAGSSRWQKILAKFLKELTGNAAIWE